MGNMGLTVSYNQQECFSTYFFFFRSIPSPKALFYFTKKVLYFDEMKRKNALIRARRGSRGLEGLERKDALVLRVILSE